MHITWANTTFENWCTGPARGRNFYEALGNPAILGPDYCPFHSALVGKTVTTRLHLRTNHFLELQVTPLANADGKTQQLLCLCRDITSEVQQQQKLDALHQASRELAGLQIEQLAEAIRN